MSVIDDVELSFVCSRGLVKGQLKIVALRANTLWQISKAEAKEFNEEVVQLLEGTTYEYELVGTASGCYIENNDIFKKSKLKSDSVVEQGRIDTGLHTGSVVVNLLDINGNTVATSQFEIRSKKVSYREEYRTMLTDISEICTDLLMDMRSISNLSLKINPKLPAQNLYQRFVFARSLVHSKRFSEAIQQIIKSPHVKLMNEEVSRDVSRGFKPSRNALNQIAKGKSRGPIPSNHPLYRLMQSNGITEPSMPKTLTLNNKYETTDTTENRFIKFVLKEFQEFFEIIKRKLSLENKKDYQIIKEATISIQLIDGILSHNFFREIKDLSIVPLSSPVLQRKSGYREILQGWLRFSLASQIEWAGWDDIFKANKRNLARLYEYWLFFQLFDIIKSVVQIEDHSVNSLIEKNPDGFGVRLKAGKNLSISGQYVEHGISLKVVLHYNRTFSNSSNNSFGGAWTRQMRPDFTISIFPAALAEEEAAEQCKLVHIHFDSKYRLDTIGNFINEPSEEESEYEEIRTYKRNDLMIMHSYKDAIRNSEGAFVLYPGDHKYIWFERDTVLPAIGAFPMTPNNKNHKMNELKQYILNCIKYLAK